LIKTFALDLENALIEKIKLSSVSDKNSASEIKIKAIKRIDKGGY
jgi:hypothetical protein